MKSSAICFVVTLVLCGITRFDNVDGEVAELTDMIVNKLGRAEAKSLDLSIHQKRGHVFVEARGRLKEAHARRPGSRPNSSPFFPKRTVHKISQRTNYSINAPVRP
uniref:Secreted protein n=1 Tax=Rhipicephalus zambeziensis TaxID=60191 RepID=A0A224YEW0_9ACAR